MSLVVLRSVRAGRSTYPGWRKLGDGYAHELLPAALHYMHVFPRSRTGWYSYRNEHPDPFPTLEEAMFAALGGRLTLERDKYGIPAWGWVAPPGDRFEWHGPYTCPLDAACAGLMACGTVYQLTL